MAQPIPSLECSPPPNLDFDAITQNLQSSIEADHDLLSRIAVTDEWSTNGVYGSIAHQAQTLQLATRQHRRLHTTPLPQFSGSDVAVVNLLGWMESIDAPYMQKTHGHLGAMNPHVEVVTEATYGMDGTIDNLPLWEKARLTQDQMAERTFEMMALVYEGTKVVVTATSQGARQLVGIEEHNDTNGRPIDIVDRILYEPCLVPIEQAKLRMLVRFAAHMAIDPARELLTRTNPVEIPEIIWNEASSLPHLRDVPAVLSQGLSLLHGTDKNVIAKLLSKGAYQIQGSRDCLGSKDIRNMLGLVSKVVPGKGHSMGMHPRKRAVAISKALRVRGFGPPEATS